MIRRRIIMVVFAAQLLAISFMMPQVASAQSQANCEGGSSVSILPKWYKYLNPHWGDPDGGGPQMDECIIDAKFPDAIPAIALAIFEIILRLSGILAVVFVTYGGFQYLTTTGEPDKAKSARTTIINALVGLMITAMATVIVNVIGRNIA